MQVVPYAQIKSFAACSPGELIRFNWYVECCLALVAAKGEQRYLISLSDHRGSGPRYSSVEDHQLGAVMSYGQGSTVEVDHGGPMGFNGSDLWVKNGTILLEEGSWLLQAHSLQEISSVPRIFCDLSSGAVVNDPSNGAVFAKWTIYPQQPQGVLQRLPALFSFSAI